MTADPLSDILSILKPESHRAALLAAGGDWSIGFPDQNGALKCNAVIDGEAWLVMDGERATQRVRKGDFFSPAFRAALCPDKRPRLAKRSGSQHLRKS